MCSTTWIALGATVATTELRRAVNREIGAPWLPQNVDRESLRMNWVVVTDENGQRHLVWTGE